jgi:dihydrolipoamide dehydrogenase
MSNFEELGQKKFKLAVIGAGPGGYVAAIRAAALGVETVLIEKEDLGGTCLNRGCIPTKSILASAKMLYDIKRCADFGIDVLGMSFDYSRIISRKDEIVSNLRLGIKELIEKKGVTHVKGRASLIDANTILINNENGDYLEISVENIILAAGSQPLCPGPFKPDKKTVITSTEALEEKSLPNSIAIVGGGVIGCEFASIYAAFGVKTTIIEGMPSILPREEKATSAFLRAEFKKQGIEVKTRSMVKSIEIINANKSFARINFEKSQPIEAQKVLVALGRAAAEDDIGLDGVGIKRDSRGFVPVDENMRTNIKNIFCIGDMTGQWLLAHTASYGGIIAAHNCAGQDLKADFSCVPNCIFTIPEISSVGLNENDCKEKGIDFISGKFPFSACGKAAAEGHQKGFVKVIAHKESRCLIGGTAVGYGASSLISEISLAVKNKLTLDDIVHTIHAHPSLPESISESCEKAIGLPVHIFSLTALFVGLFTIFQLFCLQSPLCAQNIAQGVSAQNISGQSVAGRNISGQSVSVSRGTLKSYIISDINLLRLLKPVKQGHDTIFDSGLLIDSVFAGVEPEFFMTTESSFLSISAFYESKKYPFKYKFQIKGEVSLGRFASNFDIAEFVRDIEYFDTNFNMPVMPPDMTFDIEYVQVRPFIGGTDFQIKFKVETKEEIFSSRVNYFVTTRIKAISSEKNSFEFILNSIEKVIGDKSFKSLLRLNMPKNSLKNNLNEKMKFVFTPPVTSVEHVLLGYPADNVDVQFRFKIRVDKTLLILTGGLLKHFEEMDFAKLLIRSDEFKKIFKDISINKLFGVFVKEGETWKLRFNNKRAYFTIIGDVVRLVSYDRS